ncbi:urea ABC transporter permease subunit UrtC [Paenibacillus sp.]|uniref:urea ABC transporter permease subunit UrtC n=1 Tax=Paenibacillus sp. TaxID=58172 RepID=UPI002D430C28|nr:urea ABC transporter permease subunit UrtC [Paenibacillus sp.]HZG87175.1 urea ABC transporter permease subunit UrtC [Paenibacillus sp.]
MLGLQRSIPKPWLLAGYAVAVALLLLAPMFLSDFRLNLLSKFLAFAILALGLDLLWGYTGILSLGQGVFFGLGAYCMAMYLKLESTGGKLPDFMSWSGLERLPLYWVPFGSFGFAVAAAIAVPALLAFALGWFTFRNRVRGVYFTILTQALVMIVVTLFVGQQGFTGGTNGITSFKTVLGHSLADPNVKLFLYYVTAAALVAGFVLCRWLISTRLGRVLEAIRDGENRVRFFGYNPAVFQSFAFALSGAFAGLAGMLFVFHVGIISPSMMGIVPSIEMVLWVAAGGRGTLIGAVVGTLALNWAKSLISEAYPAVWLIFLGALFIVVVVLLPKGLIGLFSSVVGAIRGRRKTDGRASYRAVLPEGKRQL